MTAPIKFFLGANTPTGFVGFTDELYKKDGTWQAYLIKSGPGTGKSSLMRRITEDLQPFGLEEEQIYCSSDPSSLDGVIYPQLKLCILDATSPHVIEPTYWGAVEQPVPLSLCMDEQRLHAQAEEIVAVTQQNRELHARCRKYIHAASALLNENRRIGEAALNHEKIRRLAARIAAREFGTGEGGGALTHRFLSAVTPEGFITFHETLQALCPRIYSIEDDQGAASRAFLAELARAAQEAGVDGIACPCPLFPHDGPEHLLFPSVGVGFTTSNSFHKADFPVYYRIHSTRFTEADNTKRQRQSFNRRAARELLEQARLLAAEAKTVHDAMEAYSVAAMDWDRAAELGNRVRQAFLAAARRYSHSTEG